MYTTSLVCRKCGRGDVTMNTVVRFGICVVSILASPSQSKGKGLGLEASLRGGKETYNFA